MIFATKGLDVKLRCRADSGSKRSVVAGRACSFRQVRSARRVVVGGPWGRSFAFAAREVVPSLWNVPLSWHIHRASATMQCRLH